MDKLKKDIVQMYSPGGDFEDWGRWKGMQGEGSQSWWIASLIRDSLNLPQLDEKKKHTVLSPSANSAIVEDGLQRFLGDEYQVISGDVADVQPMNEQIRFYRGDAEVIPLPSESVSIIYDWLGAAWYNTLLSDSPRSIINVLGNSLGNLGFSEAEEYTIKTFSVPEHAYVFKKTVK